MTWEKIGEFLPNLKDELFPQAKESAASDVPGSVQTPLVVPNLMAVPNSTPPNPISNSPPDRHPVHAQTPIHSGQTSPVTIVTPIVTPVTPTVTPGMVPIRNPLYDQAGLTSSVLLQPLNEMISTPIGISIQSQIPILYPQTTTELLQTQNAPTQPSKTELNSVSTEPMLPHPVEPVDIQRGELYAEYLTNPYHETKDLSSKDATLYDPESLTIDRTVQSHESSDLRNPLLDVLEKQKSLSANATPMHNANKAQFGSSDNVRQESSIFNFTSYFGSVNERNSEVFDTLMSTQEG
ncbi:unnamed protein product [Diatraea saccharalis]|uniref:Uncharacterized protein n=1 Tax=Diatraea saccharalis TaxID=40085 RepID=A0A9P0C5Y4_9NEOP|nr:unnamed protein product [Diatraea saccharalis]